MGVFGVRSLGSGGPPFRVPGPLPGVSCSFQCPHSPSKLLPVVHQGCCSSATVANLCAKGAIEPAPPSPSYYTCLFVTPKVTRGWRPVIDLSRLNRSVLVSHFHMETQQTVLQSLRPGDWLISLDLQDAYLQVPVHPSSRQYLRFCVGEVVYKFRVLCFGLSTTPQVFTRVMAPISSLMHRFGFRILRYLDDWLVLGSSFREIVRARDFLLWLCQELSVRVNLAKSSLTPSQTLEYLGMRLQTLPLRVFPTPKCVQKLSSLVSDFASYPLQPVSLASAVRGDVLSVGNCSGVSPPDAGALTPPQLCRLSSSGLRHHVLGRLLPRGSSVVVRRVPSSRRPPSRSFAPSAFSVYRRLGHRLGSLSRRRSLVRLMVSELFTVFDQPPGAPCSALRGSGFSSLAPGLVCQPVCGQHHSSGLSPQPGRHPLVPSELGGSEHLAALRGSRGSVGSPVHSRPLECSGRLPQSPLAGSWVGMDPVLPSLPGAPASLASDHRSFRDGFESSASSVLLADGRSAVGGHRYDDAALGQSAGICLPSVRSAPACPHEDFGNPGVWSSP